MNLYDITVQHRALFNAMANKEEWTAEDLAAIEQLDMDFETKAVGIAAYIKELSAEMLAIKDAKEQMARREKSVANRIESLKKYLLESMDLVDKKHIKHAYFDIKVKTNPPSVNIYDETIIPQDYFKRTEVYTVDKSLIKLDIDRGIDVPGAVLAVKQRIEIK